MPRPPLLPAFAGPLTAALLGVCLSGCASGPRYEPKGPCAPTCAGRTGGDYASYEAGRAAFTRATADGSFTATLEDVAWLRHEGDEESLLTKHRAYFQQGYTTFEVLLRTKDFTQPTAETFVLQDSKGTRLQGRPVTYQGAMGLEQEKYASRFSVSFRHAITADLEWLRLTRTADGGTLEWTFGGAGAASGGGQVVPAGRVVKGQPYEPGAAPAPVNAPPTAGPVPAPEGLRTLGPSYANLPASSGTGRPVNLLNHPEAWPAPAAPSHGLSPAVPAAPAVEVPAAPRVGVPPAPAVEAPAAPAASPPPAAALPPPQVRPVQAR